MGKHLFTVEEANALIPKLELIMEQLQRHGAALRDEMRVIADETGHDADEITTSELVELRPQLRAVVDDLERLVAEIEACGGQLKGLDLGLIDFPAEREGETILLCWQYGEKEITHYHTPDRGFAGRKPLDPRRQRPRYLQ